MSVFHCRSLLVVVAVAMVAGDVRSSHAATPETAIDPASRQALSVAVRGILAECLPEKFEIKDDWGDQKARFSQLKIHRDGLKLDFEKRTKEVNHGLWKKVDVTPVEPDKNLAFRIVAAKNTGPQSFAFQLFASSPLRVDARIERWRTGVKMLNFSTEAQAQVEMVLDGTLSFDFATVDGKYLLVLTPKATAVDLRLVDLDIQRISKAAGPLVHELGDLVDHPVDNFLDRFEGKITEKLNAAIAKRPEKFRVELKIPTIDFSGWSWPKSLSGE
jgi:hypothetical protein